MALHTRMNAKAIISQIMRQANGIGISKSNVRRNSKLKGQNGHTKSSYAHSKYSKLKSGNYSIYRIS